MNLEVEVLRADMHRTTAWYLQFELVQTSYPEERKLKSKRRTDLAVSGAPVFESKTFLFEGVSLARRLELKIGAIEVLADTLEDAYHIDQQAKVSSTTVQGLYTLVFTQKILSSLRDGAPFSINAVLLQPKTNKETGHILLKLSLEFSGREEQIIEDDRLVMKCAFDEYEKNGYVMQEKLEKLLELTKTKGPEVEQWIKQVDDVRNALRSLGADLVLLRREKERLEAENEEMRHQIGKLQKIEELPVLIDMLSTPSGEAILMKKLVALELRYKHERLVYEDLKTDWMRVEGKQAKARQLQEQVHLLQSAEDQSRFHLKRARDMLPAAFAAKEMVQNLDSLITALETKVSQAILKPDPGTAVELSDLKYESAQLKEKHKQIRLTLELNNGILPLDMLKEIQEGDETENKAELDKLRSRGQALLQEIEELGSRLSQQVAHPVDVPISESDLIGLQVQLQAADVRVLTMQDEMDAQATRHAREVAKMAAELAVLEARLQHRSDTPY